MESPRLRTYLVFDAVAGAPMIRMQASTMSRAAAIFRGRSVPRCASDVRIHNHRSCYSVSWNDQGERDHVFIIEEVK